MTTVNIMKRYRRMLARGENRPMASDSVHCEILKRAAEVAVGEDKLAQHLDVRSDDMHKWVEGKATAPAGMTSLRTSGAKVVLVDKDNGDISLSLTDVASVRCRALHTSVRGLNGAAGEDQACR